MPDIENLNIDFDKVIINKFQLKILKTFNKKKEINAYQFHGYFKFCSFEYILRSLQDLKKLGLIKEDTKFSPKDYLLTTNGTRYLIFLKRNKLKKLISLIGVLASISTILGLVLSLL